VRGTLAGLPDYLLGLEWPSQRRARKFTVRRPRCSKTSLSQTLRSFGFVTYRRDVDVAAGVCAAALAMVLLVRHGKA
jgi:hypothetical protein